MNHPHRDALPLLTVCIYQYWEMYRAIKKTAVSTKTNKKKVHMQSCRPFPETVITKVLLPHSMAPDIIHAATLKSNFFFAPSQAPPAKNSFVL